MNDFSPFQSYTLVIIRHLPRSTSFTRYCADLHGIEVADLKECIEDPTTLKTIRTRQLAELSQGLWTTVSPYIMVGNEHFPRIEELPAWICSQLGEESNACLNMPQLSEGRGFCMIRVIH